MPLGSEIGDLGRATNSHSGARWMVAVSLCLIMLGLACTL